MTQSLLLQSLNERQFACAKQCDYLLTRTKRHPIWALSTSLTLQSIELPIGLKYSGPAHNQSAHNQTVVVRDASSRSQLKGIYEVTWRKPLDTVSVDDNFTCTSPICTWAMASTRLSLGELVVLGDAMMRRDQTLKRASLPDFTSYLSTMALWSREHNCRLFRGYKNCCRAVRLMRPNTDSTQETRTRLALMRYHLPCPEINYQFSLRDRNLFFDMAYPQYHVCVEYDGEFHSEQWHDDVQRRQIIQDAGWKYIQVTRDDLQTEQAQSRLVFRVAQSIKANVGEKRLKSLEQRLFDTNGRIRRPLTMRELSDGRRLHGTNASA